MTTEEFATWGSGIPQKVRMEAVASTVGKMKREEVLDAAKDIITGSRQDSYGNPEDRFALIAALWDAYLGSDITRTLTPYDVAMLMVLLKVARASGGGHEDSIVDLIGYGAIAAELAEKR